MALHEHHTLHHSTLQCSAGRCITVHIALYYGTVRYSTVQYRAVQYSAIQSSTLRYMSRITTLSRAYARSPPSPIARPRPCPCDGYARRGEARREILPCRVVVVAFVVCSCSLRSIRTSQIARVRPRGVCRQRTPSGVISPAPDEVEKWGASARDDQDGRASTRGARCIPLYSIPLCSIVFHCIPLHSIAFDCIRLYSIPCRAVPCHAMPFHTIPHHSTLFHTILVHSIPFHGIEMLHDLTLQFNTSPIFAV